MNDRIQIIIVDDHPLFRDGVIQTLKAEPDIEIVGEATTALEAIRLTGELLPDLILLDITIPGGGLNAARTIAATMPVTIPLALWIVYSSNQGDRAAVTQFTQSMLIGIVPTVSFIVAVGLAARLGLKLVPMIATGYATWAAVLALIIGLRRVLSRY